jgi:hypothetical protein
MNVMKRTILFALLLTFLLTSCAEKGPNGKTFLTVKILLGGKN